MTTSAIPSVDLFLQRHHNRFSGNCTALNGNQTGQAFANRTKPTFPDTFLPTRILRANHSVENALASFSRSEQSLSDTRDQEENDDIYWNTSIPASRVTSTAPSDSLDPLPQTDGQADGRLKLDRKYRIRSKLHRLKERMHPRNLHNLAHRHKRRHRTPGADGVSDSPPRSEPLESSYPLHSTERVQPATGYNEYGGYDPAFLPRRHSYQHFQQPQLVPRRYSQPGPISPEASDLFSYLSGASSNKTPKSSMMGSDPRLSAQRFGVPGEYCGSVVSGGGSGYFTPLSH